MALTLTGRIAGDAVAQAIQLAIEYDPQPPYEAGAPGLAPQEITERLRASSRFAIPTVWDGFIPIHAASLRKLLPTAC